VRRGRVHGPRGRQVPDQVDGARGPRLQQVQLQVGRVGLRRAAVGDRARPLSARRGRADGALLALGAAAQALVRPHLRGPGEYVS